jgi:hypothetical protein
MQEKQKQLRKSNQVQIQVLNNRQEVIKEIIRDKSTAERLLKFTRTYRVVQQIEKPKQRVIDVQLPKTFMDDPQPSVVELTPKENSDELKTTEIIAIVKNISSLEELEQYMDHEMKTVRTTAEKRFKELSKK